MLLYSSIYDFVSIAAVVLVALFMFITLGIYKIFIVIADGVKNLFNEIDKSMEGKWLWAFLIIIGLLYLIFGK